MSEVSLYGIPPLALDSSCSPLMCSGSEAGSYLRLIASCITQLKAQRPSRTCNESKEEEEVFPPGVLLGRFTSSC